MGMNNRCRHWQAQRSTRVNVEAGESLPGNMVRRESSVPQDQLVFHEEKCSPVVSEIAQEECYARREAAACFSGLSGSRAVPGSRSDNPADFVPLWWQQLKTLKLSQPEGREDRSQILLVPDQTMFPKIHEKKDTASGMTSGHNDKRFCCSPCIELKAKVLEAKHQEEMLRMQQKHDAEIQKILDRKNGEIDELKSMYGGKQKEVEETVRRLENRVQSLLRESQVIRQTKEKQISELKKMSDQSAESQKNEWEKKLHVAVAEMEQEKFELQKKHTENIQELLEDTNQRLAKMEEDYIAQTHATEKMLKELEARVKRLSVEVENGNLLRQKVTLDKAELEVHIASISAELQEANHRNVSLQREIEQMIEQHEDTLQKLQEKHTADMSHFQQEHAKSVTKASEVIEDMEQTVFFLKQQIQDSEKKRQRQLREQETKMRQEMTDLQHSTDKKLKILQAELVKEQTDGRKRINTMEETLSFDVLLDVLSFRHDELMEWIAFAFTLVRRGVIHLESIRAYVDKEEQLVRLQESQRQQAQQAESALENFKKQVELSAQKTYADMKQQMERVEADLIRSKSLREKQSREFSYQLEELQQRYEQQIVELKLQHEQERTHLLQTHNAEKDSLVQDHQREIGSLEKQTRAAMVQQQTQTQELRKRDAQTVSDLESQVHSLRKELLAAHSQRKQQLIELGLLREEERQRSAHDQQMTLERLRSEMDQMRQDLKKTHEAERELTQEKNNSRMKHLEKEYSQRLAKSAQLIAERQTSLSTVKEESRKVQQNLERRLAEAQSQWDEERRQLNRDADQTSKVFQERVETLQKQLHTAEKKLMSRELENQEQITHVRQECELKIKGLMPAELRQELEDTITSLKSQVNFLQKRAAVLQEELSAVGIRLRWPRSWDYLGALHALCLWQRSHQSLFLQWSQRTCLCSLPCLLRPGSRLRPGFLLCLLRPDAMLLCPGALLLHPGALLLCPGALHRHECAQS
ncbi:Centrosomal protein of 112 kDa [Triplophysa tibetana]|uniref:Centrosomal protein of 112 kDa n=1 Tax=Triplophysa tibetana TaxID=1572043 RepID=A0A5A9N8C7_9TELE|nr:Centrosomal protein of 112 kDa [Triplophysa tibetana]